MNDEQPRLYTEVADWYHLLTAPADCAEESAFFPRLINGVHAEDVRGLFAQTTWLQLREEVGFQPTARPLEHSEVPPGSVDIFVASKPG